MKNVFIFVFYQVGETTTIEVVTEQLTNWLSEVTWKIENIFNILENSTNTIRQDVINVNWLVLVVCD